jgi:hypothetical protein
MTDTEEQELRELSRSLAQAETGAWEPRCIARAFGMHGSNRLVLTMQGWIDLELARSPLLSLQIPSGPDAVEQLGAALDAFGIGAMDLTPAEAVALAEQMIDAVQEAFSTTLRMTPPMMPPGGASSASPQGDGGYGTWLPLFAALVAQCGLSPDAAKALPVAQAYALLAAHRANQGWEPAGMTYRQRDAQIPKPAEEAR